MSDEDDRTADLLGAALAGDLDPAERSALEALLRDDPALAAELGDLQGLLRSIDDVGLTARHLDLDPRDSDLADAQALRPRVLGTLDRAATAPGRPTPIAPTDDAEDGAAPQHHTAPVEPAARPAEIGGNRRSRWRTRAVAFAAAAGLVVGVGGGEVVSRLTAPEEAAPVTGPPGTLGAVEALTVGGVPEGSEVEASFVAHTWGTETMLEIDGLERGETYEVVLIDRDGTVFESGTFIATPQRVVCRMNAAVLREDVGTLEIRDADGDLTLRAQAPAVTDS